jgi:uncharacterized OB-fold protein
MNKGWVCPKCGRVNAPFTAFCDCYLSSNKVKSNDNININHLHQWTCTGVSTAGSHYTCAICGATKIIKLYV